jgi:large conductance mechanosensitive channel
MLKEFKAFVNQGNALDLAVGVIVGAAFGKIVNSLVNDVIMPIMGRLTGGMDFKDYYLPLNGQQFGLALAEAQKSGAVIALGQFVNTVVEFFIVAFSIFLVVRQINKWRTPKAAVAAR